MLYLGLIVNGIFFFLFLKSRKVKCYGQDMGTVTKRFYQMGLYLLQNPMMEKLVNERLLSRLVILYPAYKKNILAKHYYAQKVSMVLLVLFCGTNLVCVKYISDQRNSILQEEYLLKRNEMATESTVVNLEILKNGSKTKISYDMNAKKEEKEKIQQEMQTFIDNIDNYILGENVSRKQVNKSLQLLSRYEGYAFSVEWESDRYGLIDSDGMVSNQELCQEEVVTLTAHLIYDDLEKMVSFPVNVIPVQKTDEEMEIDQITQAIQEADRKQATKTVWKLPERIANTSVTYRVTEDTSYGAYMLLLLGTVVLLYLGKDHDIEEQMNKREKELSLQYPEFVSQFVLLAGAGMSVRSIFERMAQEQAMGHYLSQEIQLLVRDYESGVLEADAIEAFSRRCQSSLYAKLGGLLIQNMKKGNQELLQQLQQEAKLAFVRRKNDARKLGEEAGTKLLFPMMGMLLVVMILIILPAFLSFQL